MTLAHMQRNGHQPIALVGGGTGLVGDPSGKTEMRKVLTLETIAENVGALKKQLSRFIDFSDDRALMLNNADWLVDLNYIHFLRDVGRHFSVNRMIKMESCKLRLDSEEGLSFLEFNYMILQAYDFLELFSARNCKLQMGGSDQWGNIVAGIELIHRMKREQAYGFTSPLITTSSGEKMGKTAGGAVWLDAERTSPYEYYQYWVNVDDRDLQRFLALYTFLPMQEIRETARLKDADLNMAKSVLAFETTALVHGHEEAVKAYRSAASVFGARAIPKNMLPSSPIPREEARGKDDAVPCTALSRNELAQGLPAFKVFHLTGMTNSSGAARRLIEQGGAYVNNNRVAAIDQPVSDQDLVGDEILLRSGKKKFHKIVVEK
jgi:tyrosyl-tRNA synthetase